MKMTLAYTPSDFALLMDKYKQLNSYQFFCELDFYGRELYTDLEVSDLVKEFFDHGLMATTICSEGKNAFQLFLDAIYEGHRYALADGGEEIRVILTLMFNHGGYEYLPIIVQDLKEVINIEVGAYLDWDEFIEAYGLYSRAFVFLFLIQNLGLRPEIFLKGKEDSFHLLQNSQDSGVLNEDLIEKICIVGLREIEEEKRAEWEGAMLKSLDSSYYESEPTRDKVLDLVKEVLNDYF